jgi:cyanophycin synthetase
MPGRMNLLQFEDFSVLVDYAHNPHALRSLGEMVRAYPASYKTGIITGVGDRRSEDIIEFGREAGAIFDHILIRHDKDLRGRSADDISNLLKLGINLANKNVLSEVIPDECEALNHAINNAISGSLIVVLTDNIKGVNDRLQYYLQLEKERNDIRNHVG